MNRKQCPLKAMAPCWKEKCAWYLVQSKQCAVPLIASSLASIKTDMIAINERLNSGDPL